MNLFDKSKKNNSLFFLFKIKTYEFYRTIKNKKIDKIVMNHVSNFSV